MKKKALSLLLAGAMTLSMGISAMATQVTAPSGTASTELEGTIKATQLVVTVPANVQFQIDPTKDASADPTAQVTQPTIEILNSSVVPVYVNINKVQAQDVKLVDDASDLEDHTQKNLMFALGEKGTSKSYTTASDWLMETTSTGGTTAYALNSTTNSKIAAVTKSSGAETPGKMELSIFARAELGWEAEDTFTITPTFVVTVVEPSVPVSANEASLQPAKDEETPVVDVSVAEPAADVPVQTPGDDADGE